MAIHCLRSLLESCRTLDILRIVASSFESVASSSLPNSSSILKKIKFCENLVIIEILLSSYTACSSISTPICRLTVFKVPIESLRTSSCSSWDWSIRCWMETVSPRNALSLLKFPWLWLGLSWRFSSLLEFFLVKTNFVNNKEIFTCISFHCDVTLPLCSWDCFRVKCC